MLVPAGNAEELTEIPLSGRATEVIAVFANA
jgi:hypothetical protein